MGLDFASIKLPDRDDVEGIDIDTTKSIIIAGRNLNVLTVEKKTFTFAAFQDVANTSDELIFNLPAKGIIEKVVLKHSAAFTGAGIVTVTAEVGPVTDSDKYQQPIDVLQSSSDIRYGLTESKKGFESWSTAKDIFLRLTSTGATLDNLATGAIEVYVFYRVLP